MSGTSGQQRTPTKLKKRGILVARRQRPRSAGRSPSSQLQAQPETQKQSRPDAQLESHQTEPAGRTSLSSLGGIPIPPLHPDGQTRVYVDLDDMELDTPRCSRSMSRSVSPDKQGGLAPASFHYPYRLRTARATSATGGEPLSVVPDLNRGIPVVPQIPAHFKAKEKGTAGNRDSGLGGSDDGVIVGDENYAVSWYHE